VKLPVSFVLAAACGPGAAGAGSELLLFDGAQF